MTSITISDQWASASSTQLVLGAVLVLIVGKILLFFHEGIQTRLRFRRLKQQGIAILEPHSLIWGHLRILGGIQARFPPDAQPHYAQIYIIQRWREFFPDAKECPSVMYVDLWPIRDSMAWVLDPGMCQELVLEKNPPRHPMTKDFISAIAGSRNLTCFDGAQHKLWRSRLAPGFSLRNIQSHMPAIVDEVEVFVRNLKATTANDGAWGSVFPLFPKVVDLTFDIIGRVVLDLQLNEQTKGPTGLQTALRTLAEKHFYFHTLANLPKRLNPFHRWEEWQCTSELRRILVPRIKEQMGVEQSETQKTVVRLAMKEYSSEAQDTKKRAPDSDIIEDVFGMTRLFLFAGHDTTATTITWAYHYLTKYPTLLEKLRAEHDQIFGTDVRTLAKTLRHSPQLLNSLPYTLAVAKEALRICPLAATIRRGSPNFVFTGNDGTRFPTDGFAIVTGTAMIDYNPELWPRVNEFVPERWIAPQEDPLYPAKQGQFRPFEYGTMNCIGQELAMTEIKLVLLFTVRELDIEPAFEEWDKLPENADKPKYTIEGERVYRLAKGISPPTEGLPVHVRLRQQPSAAL